MVSLDSGSSACPDHCVLLLGKTLSLHPGEYLPCVRGKGEEESCGGGGGGGRSGPVSVQ